MDEARGRAREAASVLRVTKTGAVAEVRRADGRREEARVSLKPLPPASLRKALSARALRARFAPGLLAGHIPDDVETAFAGTGRTLLPATADDVVVSCTCDAPLPCVHAGAAAVLLGDALAEDAFLVFLLRGLAREEVLAGLQRARRRPAPSGAARRDDGAQVPRRPEEPPEPLAAAVLERPELFYRPGEPAAALRTVFRAARAPRGRPHAPRAAAAPRLRGLAPPPRAAPRDRPRRARAPRGLGVAEGRRTRIAVPLLTPAVSRGRP